MHAVRGGAPVLAAIVGRPHAAGGNADRDARRIARIDADRGDARIVEPAAHPVLALGQVPQRFVQRPRLAVILRQEQRARNRAAPEPAGLIGTSRLQAEQVGHAGTIGVGLGKRRGGNFLPALAAIARALQLDAEMPECLRGIQRAVARIGEQHGDRITEKTRADNRPFATPPLQFEQTFLACRPADDRSSPHSLHLSTRQCLEHEHLVRIADRIAEAITIGDALAVHVDRDVSPHAVLIIQDVRPQPRLGCEHPRRAQHAPSVPGTVISGQFRCRCRFAVNATRAT